MRSTVIALVAASILVTSSWAIDNSVPPSTDRVGALAPSGTRTACVVSGVVECGWILAVDTTDATNTMSSYPTCNNWDESGPEDVYQLTIPDGGPYTVSGTVQDGPAVDLDLFILAEPCDSDNCLAAGGVTVSLDNIPSGTILYFSVDGFAGSSGPGNLTIDCVPTVAIFSDDFETGDSSLWSLTLPP